MNVLDSFRLDGKVAIVTGASSGLGVAFAEGLAEAGADVAVCARRVDRLEQTRGRGRGRRPPLRGRSRPTCPTSRTASASSRGRVDELGRVDVLVNNAGIGTAVPATREQPDEFRRVIDINLIGSYWMAQACGRAMKDGGSIVNIGSVLGSTTAGLPQAAYASSKAAIIGLTRDLAQQWTGRKGIRVNALAPGLLPVGDDRAVPGRLPRADDVSGCRPGGRASRAELVTALVFLASDAASYVTGDRAAGRRGPADHLSRAGGRATRPGPRDHVTRTSCYLTTWMVRTIPSRVCSRPSWVPMKHASTYVPGLALSTCWCIAPWPTVPIH